MAGKIYKAGMSLLVIDTENKFVSTGFAKEIARVAQGMLRIATDTIFLYFSFRNVANYLFMLKCLNATFCIALHRKILLPAQRFRCCDFCCHQDRSDRLEGFMILEHEQPFKHLLMSSEPAFVQ